MKKRSVLVLLALAFALLLSACTPFGSQPTEKELVTSLINEYGGRQNPQKIEKTLRQLSDLNPEAGEKWRRIMDYWAYVNAEYPIWFDALPEGLDSSNRLCIVVLGFQLNPDGTMRDELIGRLNIALACAEQYPNAYILCTGGGTASKNPEATEADAMAQWLMEQGVAEERIIIENKSQTTAQNAQFSHAILAEQYPEVASLVIATSDYHIPWSATLFQTQAILMGGTAPEVAAHCAMHTEQTNTYFKTQVAHMRQLAGVK